MDILCKALGVRREAVRPDSFIRDVGADSLDIAELVLGLEEEFQIWIPAEQARNVHTVGDAFDLIDRITGRRDR